MKSYLEFEKARVRWFLSINSDVLPDKIKAKGQRTFRSITIEGEELERTLNSKAPSKEVISLQAPVSISSRASMSHQILVAEPLGGLELLNH